MIDLLLQTEVQQFIKDHENHDPFSLSLKFKEVCGVPVKLVAEQIASRKRAKSKLPEWYQADSIIFPPQISMEQCSSQATALYKAQLVKGHRMYDLTGGYGIDCYYLSKRFEEAVYVERHEHLCEIAAHNFHALGSDNITVCNEESIALLKSIENTDLVYIDPARRDENSQKVVLLEDCEPDVTLVIDQLKGKAREILIKTSPMLDIHLGLKSLDYVKAVHIVSVNNECKEVLYHIDFDHFGVAKTHTVNLHGNSEQAFSFHHLEEVNCQANYGELQGYLYEPNSSVMKAGAFNMLTHAFPVKKMHPNTHLYTSNELVDDFPGRKFKVKSTVPYNKKKILSTLGSKKANITTRNFPEEVKSIRKKTGLQEGGDLYLFAFTDLNNQKVIAITEKA